jgi:hypothetical protein
MDLIAPTQRRTDAAKRATAFLLAVSPSVYERMRPV